ncbi:MAG: rhodanese-like domain-containing protein [Gammaproteobacteria bacterium]|nr:rhodanese-like domain-containing protein [Gammaproteobacteria bacterium]
MRKSNELRKDGGKKGLSKWIIIMLSGLVVILTVIIVVLVQTDQRDQINNGQVDNGQIYRFMTPQDAVTLMEENQSNPNFFIIDDRPTNAFNSGHIGNATSIPWGPDFADRVSELDRSKIYLVYCSTGCGASSQVMNELGFREIYDIAGGLNAWEAEGLPIEN